ncbi:hypothetical protein J2S74_002883 [Evansella vedderi]|uniref:Uncharacterized protein n=1 Tax=Evansella vedderi TaxID=38282 RepID=A0ABT9ZW93_9BACI|nr:hypothetical protein [Evansella vedderi]MDQ0255501.1 hypothetical protein [Evansella vedderi]
MSATDLSNLHPDDATLNVAAIKRVLAEQIAMAYLEQPKDKTNPLHLLCEAEIRTLKKIAIRLNINLDELDDMVEDVEFEGDCE